MASRLGTGMSLTFFTVYQLSDIPLILSVSKPSNSAQSYSRRLKGLKYEIFARFTVFHKAEIKNKNF